LPVTAGTATTLNQIVAYSVVLIGVVMLPYILGFSGMLYAAGAAVLNLIFISLAVLLRFADDTQRNRLATMLFAYSIFYLFLIFTLLLADRLVG
jgi:protoheme IX farnesyltransferase